MLDSKLVFPPLFSLVTGWSVTMMVAQKASCHRHSEWNCLWAAHYCPAKGVFTDFLCIKDPISVFQDQIPQTQGLIQQKFTFS